MSSQLSIIPLCDSPGVWKAMLCLSWLKIKAKTYLRQHQQKLRRCHNRLQENKCSSHNSCHNSILTEAKHRSCLCLQGWWSGWRTIQENEMNQSSSWKAISLLSWFILWCYTLALLWSSTHLSSWAVNQKHLPQNIRAKQSAIVSGAENAKRRKANTKGNVGLVAR